MSYFSFVTVWVYSGSRERVVGIASAYRLDGRGCRSLNPGKDMIFLLSTSSTSVMASTQPPIKCVTGTLSQGVKRPGREADQSYPTSAEVVEPVARLYTD
jgi:hypothetical protein